jgi:hypothetical protein
VLDGSNELRVMLCRERAPQGPGQKRTTNVLAACGACVAGDI